MIQTLARAIDFPTFYPDSDGKPMADNTLQYRWIVLLVSNLKHLFRGQTVFVAGDLLWYPQPVTQHPALSQAPDAMVVFGRPGGDRRSYKQWEEDNVAPQVVFSINNKRILQKKLLFKQAFHGKRKKLTLDDGFHTRRSRLKLIPRSRIVLTVGDGFQTRRSHLKVIALQDAVSRLNSLDQIN